MANDGRVDRVHGAKPNDSATRKLHRRRVGHAVDESESMPRHVSAKTDEGVRVVVIGHDRGIPHVGALHAQQDVTTIAALVRTTPRSERVEADERPTGRAPEPVDHRRDRIKRMPRGR